MYFENVKINDEVYGLIFGKGVVTSVWDGYYKFEVTYPNDYVVPYTDEGIQGSFFLAYLRQKEEIENLQTQISNLKCAVKKIKGV